jgi:hypothetical protein
MISSVFGIKSNYSIAYESLINDHSYRIYRGDPLFKYFLSQFKFTLKKVWGRKYSLVYSDNSSDAHTAVIYANPDLKHQVIEEYLIKQQPDKIKFGLSPDALILKRSFFSKLSYTFLLALQYGILFTFSLFNKDKRKVYIIISELLEVTSLLQILQMEKIKDLYTFNSFERYSNLLAIVLNKKGIKIHRVCSPNPLRVHYSKVIGDTFIFTSPYQRQEYELLKQNWRVKEFKNWPVYAFTKYLNLYYKKNVPEASKNVIGFYSSGYSKRFRDKHSIVDDRFANAEIDLLKALNFFLKVNRQCRLKIFPHPIEKESIDTFEYCQKEYALLLHDCKDQFFFNSINGNTTDSFLTIDTAVSIGSSVNFERLFCGYKTLFVQLGFKTNPFEETIIDLINIKDVDHFNSKLYETLQLSNAEFFRQNNLEEFYYGGLKINADIEK